MVNSAKAKGDRGERELERILPDLLGLPWVRRALGAGRQDDVGDIDGIPNTIIQVTWREDLAAAIREKLPASEVQRKNARKLFAATFIRRSRSKEPWIVVMSPPQFARLWKYANKGVACTREERAAKMNSRGRQPRGSG